MKKKFLPLILCAALLVGCGSANNESGASEGVGTGEVASNKTANNVFTLDGIGGGGTCTLHEDNSVELDIGDVHYIGYVTPADFEQNYHLSAVEPNFNFSYLVSGEDVQIHYLDCDIVLCDVDMQGNECYVGTIVNLNYSADPSKTSSSKEIEERHTENVGNPLYFARFVTVVDDSGNTLYKIAQQHSSQGFLFSGEINVDGKTYNKDSNLTFYDENGRHIFGEYANEITFAVDGDGEYLEIVLSLVDAENGTYKQKSIETADTPFSRSEMTVDIDYRDHSLDTIVTEDGEYTWDEYFEAHPEENPKDWGN
jgi:hypothetical protein